MYPNHPDVPVHRGSVTGMFVGYGQPTAANTVWSAKPYVYRGIGVDIYETPEPPKRKPEPSQAEQEAAAEKRRIAKIKRDSKRREQRERLEAMRAARRNQALLREEMKEFADEIRATFPSRRHLYLVPPLPPDPEPETLEQAKDRVGVRIKRYGMDHPRPAPGWKPPTADSLDLDDLLGDDD